MGCNYYLLGLQGKQRSNSVEYGHYAKKHLGKSSLGWPFMFFALSTFDSIKNVEKNIYKPNHFIIDEYNRTIDKKDFLEMMAKTYTGKAMDMYKERFKFPKSYACDDGFVFTTTPFS